MLRIFLCLIFLCNQGDAAWEESPDKRLAKSICDEFAELEKLNLLNGVIMVAKGRKEKCFFAGGTFRLFEKNYMSEESQFLIGTITQQFTVALVVKAFYDNVKQYKSEEERVRRTLYALNQPLEFFLPDGHPVWKGIAPGWIKYIKIKHLLTHTSGIKDYIFTKGFRKKPFEKKFYELYHNDAQLLDLIKQEEMLFEPGSRFSYSNTNILLLRGILEMVTQKPFSENLNELLYQTQMWQTINPSKGNYKDFQKLNDGFTFDEMPDPLEVDHENIQTGFTIPIHPMDFSNLQGVASMISTYRDLWRWNQALHIDKEVFPEALYNEVFSDQLSKIENYDPPKKAEHIKYGLGFSLEKLPNGQTLYGHMGKIGVFASVLWYLPESRITVIALSNVTNSSDKKSPYYTPNREGFEEIYARLERVVGIPERPVKIKPLH